MGILRLTEPPDYLLHDCGSVAHRRRQRRTTRLGGDPRTGQVTKGMTQDPGLASRRGISVDDVVSTQPEGGTSTPRFQGSRREGPARKHHLQRNSRRTDESTNIRSRRMHQSLGRSGQVHRQTQPWSEIRPYSWVTKGPHILTASSRQQTRLATSNAQAALDLHEREKQLRILEKMSKTAKAQFVVAALRRPPKRFVCLRTLKGSGGSNTWQVSWPSPPLLWVKLSGDTSLPGAGRRVSTLRGQVRAVRRFLKWLWENHSVTFPTALEQLFEYLHVRLGEPYNRGSLRNAHEAMAFLEEAAAIKAEKRLTSMSLNAVGHKELLSKALPRNPSKQAPRMHTTMLAG